MNRRSFFQAAALSTAPALQSRWQVNPSLPPVSKAPIEVDLADPDAARHIGNPETDFFVLLEEMYGDPGQLSGTSLRIMGSGKFTTLNAEVASAQRDGSYLSHCYGYLNAVDLGRVGADPADVANGAVIRLRELYPYVRPDLYNGAHLTLDAGECPRLLVWFGSHVLGVLRGRLLARFLDCVRQRMEDRAIV